MSQSHRTVLGSAGLSLGLAVLCFILILTALHAVGTDSGLYYVLQMKAGILPAAGIADGDLQTLDAALADYLAGDESALLDAGGGARAVPVDGEFRPAFNAREMAHMADCFGLFALLRKVRRRLVPWAVMLIAGGAWLLDDRKRIRRCALLSPLILLVPLGAFALWATLDFDGAFTFFHRVLFANDLWLLDWRTDLLIRICPESMFMAMGLRIALWSAAILVAVPAVTVLLTGIRLRPKTRGDHSWNDNRTTRRGAALRRKTFDIGERR